MLIRVSKQFDSIMSMLNKAANFFAALILAVLFIVMISEVVSRYFLQTSLAWVVEFATFGLVWVVFLAGSCLFYDGGHISVDFINKFLPAKVIAYSRVVFDIILLYFVYTLVVHGYDFALRGLTRLSPSELTYMVYPRLAIPVGSFLMALQIANNLLKHIIALQTPEAVEVPEEIESTTETITG